MAARPPARAKTPEKIAASVDEYLARIDEPERTTLTNLRAQIRQAAPKATEVISCRSPRTARTGRSSTSLRSRSTSRSPS